VPYAPQAKQPGEVIRSADWNAMMAEILRLKAELEALQKELKVAPSAPSQFTGQSAHQGPPAGKSAAVDGQGAPPADAPKPDDKGAPKPDEKGAPKPDEKSAPKEEPKSPDDQILRHDDPRLSAHRKKLLAELDIRLPSTDGVPAASGKKNLFDGTQKQTSGTSCGLLPTVLMQYGMGIGVAKNGLAGVFGYGTEGIKAEGRKLGVWVESDGTAMPLPGDIYTLRYGGDAESDRVSHVGIIVDLDPKDGSTWVTGDSGQDRGPVRGAKYCQRPMRREDGVHPYLKGEYTTALRRIGGWVDLDRLMAALGK
jgi:hypothetical protein